MHICNDCHWMGSAPDAFPSIEARTRLLLALAPGAPVPSGICPNCDGATVPVDLPAIQIPEGVDRDASMPFTGWRWNLAVTQTRHAVALYLRDRVSGAMSEITVDSCGGRVRLEITSFDEKSRPEEAESQLLLSLGRGHVAAFPAGEVVAHPLVYGDLRVEAAEAATRQEFMAIEDGAPLPIPSRA